MSFLHCSLTYVQVLISHSLPSLGHVWTRQSGFSDGDRPEILSDDILRMVPFLGDVKSTLRFASIREVWEDVWTHMGEANSLNTRQATDSRRSVSRLLPTPSRSVYESDMFHVRVAQRTS